MEYLQSRYDNLKSAVKKILRGHQREETMRFMAFRSIGVSSRSSAPRRKLTRRVAWKEKADIFAGTTWCRYRRLPAGKR